MRFVACLLLLTALPVLGQEAVRKPARQGQGAHEGIMFGPGVGLDHGGVGLRFDAPLSKNFAFTFGAGYAVAGVGLNAGMLCRVLPEQRLRPYLHALYGYNAAIKVKGMSSLDRIYWGPSAGAGLELGARNGRGRGMFRVGLLVPFRNADFTADLKRMKGDPNIIMYAEPPPVLISVGYHFGL